MILKESYTLANGMNIPKLGLGTWFIDDSKAAEAVRTAVKLGYRLIDTAQAYGNERGVGDGVRTCGVPREESHDRRNGKEVRCIRCTALHPLCYSARYCCAAQNGKSRPHGKQCRRRL